jgi:hypothetical protein
MSSRCLKQESPSIIPVRTSTTKGVKTIAAFWVLVKRMLRKIEVVTSEQSSKLSMKSTGSLVLKMVVV